MAVQKLTIEAANEAELKDKVTSISRNHPDKAVTVLVSFGTCRVMIYDSLSRVPVDSPDTRQMLFSYGGLAFVNGELKQPTLAQQVKINQAQYTKDN